MELQQSNSEQTGQTQPDYETILNHIVLPRVLPNKLVGDHEHQELIILSRLVKSIEINAEWIPAATVRFIKSLNRVHDVNRNGAVVSEEINALQPGDTFGIFIHLQNTALSIHMPTDQNDDDTKSVFVSTFPGSVPLSEVYKHDGDFELIYPLRTLKMKHSKMMRSEAFAHQLCILNDKNPVERNSRDIIETWLMPILSDGDTTVVDFPKITKKIRDEIIGEGKKQESAIGKNRVIYQSTYFRRSKLYLAIKAFLQFSLTIELGADKGRFVYKIAMLHFMTELCKEFTDLSLHPQLDIDLITQFLAKIARRIEKLRDVESTNDANDCVRFYQTVIGHAKDTVSKVRIRIDQQIQELQTAVVQQTKLVPLKELNFEKDVHQNIPNLRHYLELRKATEQSIQKATKFWLTIHPIHRHKIEQTGIPQVGLFLKCHDDIERHLFLTDIENWILYELNFEENAYSCAILYDLYIQYIFVAESFHANDPLGISKMMLVRLKIVAMIDRIAAEIHPLLLQHRSGIDTKIFDILLLPQAIDLRIAFALQNYLDDRNRDALYPSLIEEEEISSNAFSVRFARQNETMKSLRAQILVQKEAQIADKRREWERGREIVQSIQAELLTMTCISNVPHTRHVNCRKCELDKRVAAIKIWQIEEPLPNDENLQYGIIFELKIPAEISAVRDALHFTTRFGQQSNNEWALEGNVVDNYHIAHYNVPAIQRHVNLGSKTSTILKPLHVDKSFNRFVVRNGWTCVLHGSPSKVFPSIEIEAIKKHCTLNVDPMSPYASLQWTLNTTSHTQNQILARQAECQNLSLSEFIEFGSLRADGHRLQLRKLYATIETESLSFGQPSVLSLIQQTIYETGVCGKASYARESHEDFTDCHFVSAMIDLLHKFIKHRKNNWSQPIKLLVITLITVRLFELNSERNVADRIVGVINELRSMLMEWIVKIEKTMREMHNRTRSAEGYLRSLLITVSITGAMTFFVSSEHKFFEEIFRVNPLNGFTAPRTWLQSIITLNNNILLNSYIGNATETQLKMLIRMVRFTGIQIESKIRRLMKLDRNDIFELIKRQWSLAEQGHLKKDYFSRVNSQMFVVEIEIANNAEIITLDIITGSFLVNKLPVARLPSVITSNPLYRDNFGDYTFEVQPDGMNSFSTIYKYNDRSYEFKWTNELIIFEHHTNGRKMELIPKEILSMDIPELLAENYSHWWCENIINFRPNKFTDENFFNEAGIEYTLDLDTNRLIETKTRRCIFDINSDSVQKIHEHLSRLERQRYIHVLMETVNIATIELVRMNLKFKIDCSTLNDDGHYDMLSNEFSRMRVSLEQNCGTLYGLSDGILLESTMQSPSDNTKALSKCLLLPHSNVLIYYQNSDLNIEINLDIELRSPPFHRYQVDELLRQLKPSNSSFSAWFYLAYLHAITSHGEVEPLTGMSGTERALQILQSSVVWSSAPYDDEAIKTLEFIANLTPNRKLIESIQKIDWPVVPTYCAQDSFIFIVRKLMKDSQRLNRLHFRKKTVEPREMNDLKLNKREYLRCLQFKPNLRIDDIFIEHESPKTVALSVPAIKYSNDIRIVSILYHTKKRYAVDFVQLKAFLTSNKLDGPIFIPHIPGILKHELTMNFRKLWLSLYEVARTKQFDYESFGLVWSLFAHEPKYLNAILILQTVNNNASLFTDINPPTIELYPHPGEIYDCKQISNILRSCASEGLFWSERDDKLDYNEHDYNERHDNLKKEIVRIITYIDRCWPCNEVNLIIFGSPYAEVMQLTKANALINEKLYIWNMNRQLFEFIDEIERKFLELEPAIEIDPLILSATCVPSPSVTGKNWSKYHIDFETKLSENINEFEEILNEANMVWQQEADSMRSVDQWWSIYKKIVETKMNHLIDAGIHPRMVPSLVLPRITCEKTDPKLKCIIGAYALEMAHKQRSNRIKCYDGQPNLKPTLDRELENEPHVNWKLCEYPEWLLFEIEQNLTIRRVQIEIAKRMIDPPDVGTKHSVMQLNMGEGKTAVIVPILAAVLANGDQACQITVLKSLFATNLNSLRQYLGGMLNRRIYTFPCRRDMKINQCIDEIMNIYRECKMMRGVILTLPEYRLSFQLKAYESLHKGNKKLATQILSIQKWINTNVRNILDESDAILHPKYQLVYTVGNQLKLDGDAYRWLIVQALLKRVPIHMKVLQLKLGEQKIEFNHNYIESGPVYGAPLVSYRSDVFTPCRILDESVFEELKAALIADFIEARLNNVFPELSTSIKNDIQAFLSGKESDQQKCDELLNKFSANHRNILMILNGLLRFEVLKFALMKRWRVNYGISQNGRRKMAIPFRAKDVAAEMTEFGHPDIAICLTQLSYYYSGLSDDQLTTVFEVLLKDPNGPEIYDSWINSVPNELVDSSTSVRLLSAVNLKDSIQKNEYLFPLFRFNMYAVDFWLSLEVYPHEAKSFERKLMCSAWDLCSDHLKHRVTGFSGTNDTKNILPLPIAQNDLEELEKTNESVRQTLLRPENQAYQKLPPNVSGKTILERLVANGIPILLDAGALMLELTNEQMAKEWLKLAAPSTFDAAVYFDSNDVLQTIDRNGTIAAFDCSVYRDDLSKCLVYLDDVHTRGTDLKFPIDWKACVTLSGDIARDKTVQACMRMRQLGKGHSIAFWASHEADIRIRDKCDLIAIDSVTNEHVIEFICQNSKIFECKNTGHWAAAGYNYTKKFAANKDDNLVNMKMVGKLFEKCVDTEYVTLQEMYGDEKQSNLDEMYESKFQNLEKTYEARTEIVKLIRIIKMSICDKLKARIHDLKQFKHTIIDEEQEKELELEQHAEKQRQIERPDTKDPAVPYFDEILMQLFCSNQQPHELIGNLLGTILFSLHSSLKNTQLFTPYTGTDCPWSEHLFVSRDFVQVLETNNTSEACDEYLRPVWWIGCIQGNENIFLVLLSSFECEHLIPTFRKSKTSALHMYRPKINKLHDNLLHEHRIRITGMPISRDIDLRSAIEIGVYAGSMYFKNDAEQNGFCSFLGLIPRPRTNELEIAFEEGLIKPNGFVLIENRNHSDIISKCVGQCRFVNNPVELVIKLIVAHHQFMRKESHVAAIVDRGIKLKIVEHVDLENLIHFVDNLDFL